MKVCIHCKESKSLDSFYLRKDTGKYRNVCTPCRTSQQRLWTYSITEDQYNSILQSQSNKCPICLKDFNTLKRNKICIDHCHNTGEVRGVLCTCCNSSIGKIGEVEGLVRALKYLKGDYK